jgi:hypothetical protein
MNRQSASRPAPFNTRVLIGLALLVADVSLALLASSALSASGSDLGKAKQTFEAFTYGKDPLVPPLFDCSKIHQLGIDKQRNFRAGAILIFCGQAQRGSASHFGSLSRISERLLPAQMYGTADVDLIESRLWCFREVSS